MRRFTTLFSAVLLLAGLSIPAAAAGTSDVIPLPDGFQPEGIAVADDGTFWVGSLHDGSIYRGDVTTGDGEIVFTPEEPQVAVGLWYDEPTGWLFAGGGPLGTAYVFDGATGDQLAEYDLGGTFINDVVVTRDAAYLTDSAAPVVHVIPFGPGRSLPTADAVTSVPLGGDFEFVAGAFNSNGIEASRDGSQLIVASSATATLYLVDPETGVASAIDLGDASLRSVDGILLRGRTLFAVQNSLNQISAIRLSSDLSSGWVGSIITSPDFRVPTTVGTYDRQLFAVNARFDVAPPFGDPVPDVEFDVVRTPLRCD